MFSRIRRSSLLLLTASLAASTAFCGTDSPEVAKEEAATLYRRANDYVTRISEDDYSYAYLQFYWKRAQANLDRIGRVYPNTETGKQLRADDAKIGPFELSYFKERVLPRVEEKRVASFDAVNCAIFLFNLEPSRWDATRLGALQSILEVLSRQKRWSEALSFPVLDKDRPLLVASVFRIAARYDQQKIVDELLANTTAKDQALLWPILGEAMALNGTPRTAIAKLLDKHPQDAVKLAVLNGMITREIDIQRAAQLKLTIKDGIQKTHYSVLKLDVRDDVDSVAKTFFPEGNETASIALTRYHAALGQRPAPDALVEVHQAYLESLATGGKIEEMKRYLATTSLRGADRTQAELKLVELFAQLAHQEECDAAKSRVLADDPAQADAAAIAEFQGKMDSLDAPLTVREHTFSDLTVKDPCLLAQAVMDWSLTPNRNIRGAAPWDSVVHKFLPGFANLPLPKSKAVQDASSASKPF
ncbi:MAG TPA: hypothetical protein VFT72_20030 [Opitutaceae bacterium]|nr:hypothetical protein [Opitutaceae bacterium]